MHYVVTFASDEDAAYLFAGLFAGDEPWTGCFNEGQALTEEVPALKALTSENHGEELRDVIRNTEREFIVSQRVLDVLESAGVTNVQMFPLAIEHHATGENSNYWLCNVVGTIPCFDRERAEFRADLDDPTAIGRIYELAVDEALISSFNASRKPDEQIKLFRLQEDPSFLLASDDVARALIDAEITGLEIVKPEDWE